MPAHGHKAISEAFLREQLGDDYGTELYILTIEGDCLESQVHHGDSVLIAPAPPVRCGDFVVLHPADPTQRPIIKRCITPPPPGWPIGAQHPDSGVVPVIIVEQLNPPRRYTVPVNRLSALHRVVATLRPGEREPPPAIRDPSRGRPSVPALRLSPIPSRWAASKIIPHQPTRWGSRSKSTEWCLGRRRDRWRSLASRPRLRPTPIR